MEDIELLCFHIMYMMTYPLSVHNREYKEYNPVGGVVDTGVRKKKLLV
jgi:hypothetical protein